MCGFIKRTQNAIRSKCMLQEKEYLDMLAGKSEETVNRRMSDITMTIRKEKQ